MPETLAIVGASARAAAASAVRAGFQPVTADLFADLDLRRIATATRISPYPEGLLDWLRAIEPPAWMYTGALENHPELIDQMAWIAPLWGNPGDVLQDVRNPSLLAAALRDSGFFFPETRTSSDGLPRDGSWLVKTYRGASGSGVRAFAGDEINLDAPYFFQKQISGTPCAGVFVANGGSTTLLGLTRQLIGEAWVGAREFHYAGTIGLYPAAGSTIDIVERVGSVLSDRFSLLGLFGVDFIIDVDDVWTIEVNPRYTASVEIVERATHFNAISAHVAAFKGTATGLPLRQNPTTLHGKAELFARRPIEIRESFSDWALEQSHATPWPKLADISPANTSIAVGRPVLTVFASGSSVDDVEQQLRQRVAEVEAKLYAK